MTPDTARARLRRAHAELSRRDADRHPLSQSTRRERWEATHARRRTAELDSCAAHRDERLKLRSEDLQTRRTFAKRRIDEESRGAFHQRSWSCVR